MTLRLSTYIRNSDISMVIASSRDHEMKEERYWGRFAKTYDQDGEYVVGEEILRQIVRRISEGPDLGMAIELGCGTGFFSRAVAQKADHLTATDLSDEMLTVAQARLMDLPNVTVKKADCRRTGLPSDTYDSVVMINLIHVIDEPERAIQESHRLLKKDGVLLVVSLTTSQMALLDKTRMAVRYLRRWGAPPRGGQHGLSATTLSDLVRANGFNVESCDIIGGRAKAIYLESKK